MLPGDFGTKIILFGESASGGAGLRMGAVSAQGLPRVEASSAQGLPGPPRVETLGYYWEEVVSPLGCSGKRTEVRGIGAPAPQCCMSAKKIRYMASCIEAMPRSGL